MNGCGYGYTDFTSIVTGETPSLSPSRSRKKKGGLEAALPYRGPGRARAPHHSSYAFAFFTALAGGLSFRAPRAPHLSAQAFDFFTASVSAGTIWNRSPTMP